MVIYFLAPRGMDFGIREFLELWARDVATRFTFLFYEDLPDCVSVTPGTYILAALDQLTDRGTGLVDEFEQQLRTAGPRVRVLNSARGSLRRFELLDTLRREGLNRHGAARVTSADVALTFPVFLREEHQHSGAITSLLWNPAAVRHAIARAVVLGYRLSDLLLVEHFEAADTQGLYRKYAAHVMGSEILPHFVDIGTDWMLHHGGARFTAEMFLEDQTYVRTNPHEAELRRIFALANVQFGRIDYTLKDGVIETWEINLNPTFARYPPLPEELERIRLVTTLFFAGRFGDAVRAIDLSAAPGRNIPIRFSAAALEVRGRMIRPRFRQRFPPALVRASKPIRRVIESAVRILSPLIVRRRCRVARPDALGV